MNENQIPSNEMILGHEVVDGQKISIPQHNIVNFLGKELPKICPSTIGIVSFTGGVPEKIIIVECKNKEYRQTCYKCWKQVSIYEAKR